MPTPIDLENRIIKRYAGNGISISNDRVISVLLRAANNLAKFTDDEHGELYVDLQLPDGLTPSSPLPVGVNVGHVLQTDGRPATGVVVVHKTTSGEVVKLLFAANGYVYKDVGDGFVLWANVKTVNNIGPDANGNIAIKGSDIPLSATDITPVSQKITDEINRATVKEGELEEAIEEVEDAVTLLNSSDTTSGSVAYAVKQEATARYEEDEDIRDNLQTKQSNLTSEQLDTVNGDRFSAGNYSTTAEMNAAIQQAIYAAEGGLFQFKGYVSTVTPSGDLKIGNLWINSATMPSSFPVTGVKIWSGASWEDTTNYTPDIWDLRANLDDDHGYYWFNIGWNVIDGSVDLSNYYTITEVDTKLATKQNSLTNEQMEVVNSNPLTDDLLNKLNGIESGATDVAITNNLTTQTSGTALDAAQGYVLKQAVDSKADDAITLTDENGSTTLPATASGTIKSKIQALRNNVKMLFSYFTNGIANAASKLNTARSLTTDLANTSTASTFDGSADQNSIKITGTLGETNGGTGASGLKTALEGLTDELTWSTQTIFEGDVSLESGATLDASGGTITGIATPTGDGDAANKAYVDNLVDKDIKYTDFQRVTKSGTTITFNNKEFNCVITPTGNFSINAGSGLIPGGVYVLKVTVGTVYTVTLGTGVTNMGDVDLTLTTNKQTIFVLQATNATSLQLLSSITQG